MIPEGLKYVNSWREVNGNRCFQLMECDDVQTGTISKSTRSFQRATHC
jgi:hypothetical protein